MQNSIASSEVVTGPSVPGTMGTPASIAACLAATYQMHIYYFCALIQDNEQIKLINLVRF